MDHAALLHSSRRSAGSRPRRCVLLLLVAALLVLIAGCTLPEAPGDWSWDTRISVPLGVRTYGLSDLVDPDSILRRDGSGIGMSADSLLYYSSFSNLTYSLFDSLIFSPLLDTLVKRAGLQDTTAFFELPDLPHRLFLGIIADGSVHVTAHNPAAAAADTVTVTIPNLLNPLGDMLRVQMVVPGFGSADSTIDLSAYRIRLADVVPQQVETRLHSAAGAAIVAIVESSELRFTYFEGVVNNLTLGADESAQSIALLPEGWETIYPVAVEARLRPRQQMSATATVALDVRTYRGGVELARRQIQASGLFLGADTTAVFPGLEDLLSVYPDSIHTTGTLTISGEIRSYTNVSVGLEMELHAPLAFTMDATHAPGTIEQIDSGDLQDIQSGTALIRVWNRLPVGGQMFIVLDSVEANLRHDSGADVDTIAMMELPLPDYSGGRAVGDTYRELTVELSESTLNLFRRPPFFARTDLRMPGSGGDTLLAHAGDYVKLQVTAQLVYRINAGDTE